MLKKKSSWHDGQAVDTLIGAQVVLHGDLQFSGGLVVEGRIHGRVFAAPGQPATLTLSTSPVSSAMKPVSAALRFSAEPAKVGWVLLVLRVCTVGTSGGARRTCSVSTLEGLAEAGLPAVSSTLAVTL